MKRPFILFVLIACFRPRPSAQDSGIVLIQNATILTITHGNIEHGSILIREEKSQQLGRM